MIYYNLKSEKPKVKTSKKKEERCAPLQQKVSLL